MTVICPTITADTEALYAKQMDGVKDFIKRIHIDLMDGEFAPSKSIKLSKVWWPHNLTADIHLMYQHPMKYIDKLIALKPHMVIIHNEAEVHHMHFSALLHQHDIETGLALLQDTPVEWAEQIMHSFDQILIFSGHLGYQGGKADLDMLEKAKKIQALHPDAEIAWDGGINNQNIRKLAEAGIDVLNVGGYIQASASPKAAYDKLEMRLKY